MNTVLSDFRARIEADSEIQVGKLPWRMSPEEWEYFRDNPESFRKRQHVASSGDDFWKDMYAWAHNEGKYAKDKKEPMAETVVVTLTQEEYDHAIAIGTARFD